MSDQRKPLVGFTAEYLPSGSIRVFAPSGKVWGICDDPDEWGIPLPPEPRTGRLGLNEAETRKLGGERRDEWTNSIWDRAVNAAITMCREDVAEWDAQPEPDTLTVTLPIELVRRAAKWLYPDIGNACHAALDAAGLA